MPKDKYWIGLILILLEFTLSPGQYLIRRNGTFLNQNEEDNFWSHHPPGKPHWLLSNTEESFFRPSREILTPQFTNIQATSKTPEKGPESNPIIPLDDDQEKDPKISSWNQHYQPEEIIPDLLYPKQKNRKKRHRKRQQAANRQTVACAGTCRNAFSCMITGYRADKSASDSSCPGMMNVCCIRWGTPLSASLVQNSRRRKRQRQKGGRALSSLFTPYYTAGNEDLENAIPGSTKKGPLPGGDSLLDFAATTVSAGFGSIFLKDDDHSCGQSKNAQRKIMGGLDAGYGQFPWTAYIKVRGPGIDKVCSGTLVAWDWVVTAGHCTQYCVGFPECSREIAQSEITYKVILGDYDLYFEEDFATDVFLVIEVLRHPQYQNVMRYRDNGILESEPRYDISLMRLDRPAKMAPNIGRICLPPLRGPVLTSPDTLATVVGWGRLGSQETDPHSNVLQAVTVPILGDDQCQQETGLPLYNDQLCAGGTYTEESACPGDSGGGLQVQDDYGRWTLVGIVSNGPSICGLQPVVFHKVEHSIDWIVKTMQYKYSIP